MSDPFLRLLQEKVIVGDGAMGTMLQARGLTADDFGGLEGCNEYLAETRPQVVAEIHAAYFAAGADVVETDSFGASTLVLAEYGLEHKAFDLSRRAAEIARRTADDFGGRSGRRFVAGSIGPTSKLPTLGHATFDQMRDSYLPCMRGLLEGGIDLFQIETCQDILQAKCAVISAREAMRLAGREVPICVTFTVEASGTMLLGTDPAAALTVFESLGIDIVGLNCATGPDLMEEHVRFLCRSSSAPVAVLPNAGLPRNVDGRAVYQLGPLEFAAHQERFVREHGVSYVGGCCGTSPEHIRILAERVGGLAPAERRPEL